MTADTNCNSGVTWDEWWEVKDVDIGTFSKALTELPGQRTLVLCHENADGDALGSALAIADLIGGQVGVPGQIMEHSLGFARAIAADICIAPNPLDYDLTVIVDCASARQLPGVSLPERFLLIDHHTENTLKPAAAIALHQVEDSTCQLVYRIYRALGRTLTPRLALALAGGIVSDTVGLTRASNHTLAQLAAVLQEGSISLPAVLSALQHCPQTDKLQRLQIASRVQASTVGNLAFAYAQVDPGYEYYGTMLLLDLGADIALCYSQQGATVDIRLAISPAVETINAHDLLSSVVSGCTVETSWGHQRFAGLRAKGKGEPIVQKTQQRTLSLTSPTNKA